MNRREFLKKAAIVAAGVVAADQLELLDRLAPRRLYFPGTSFKHQSYALGFEISDEMIEDDVYRGMLSPGYAEKFRTEVSEYHMKRLDNLLVLRRDEYFKTTIFTISDS